MRALRSDHTCARPRAKTHIFEERNLAKLITTAGTPKMGYLEPTDFERTVKVLLAAGSSPVIKEDSGKAADSHAVWETSSN